MSFTQKLLRVAIGLSLCLVGTLSSAEPIRIGVGIDASYAPLFIAQHRGLFKQAGLDVEVKRFTQGGESIDAVIAGQTQLSTASEFSTIMRMPRGDLRPLALFEESGTYIKLAVRPGIETASQIRKFGVIKGSASEYTVQRALIAFKLDRASVQLVNAAPPELPALMARGDIDAMFIWEPWPGIAVRQGARIIATSGEVGYAYHMWLTAHGAWLDAHRDEAQKILRVVEEANRQILADPAAASRDLQAVTRLPAADTIGFLKDTRWKVRDFAAPDIAGYDQVAEFLTSQKILPTKVDIRKSLQVGFYKE